MPKEEILNLTMQPDAKRNDCLIILKEGYTGDVHKLALKATFVY
jgi:hypothetical protein